MFKILANGFSYGTVLMRKHESCLSKTCWSLNRGIDSIVVYQIKIKFDLIHLITKILKFVIKILFKPINQLIIF